MKKYNNGSFTLKNLNEEVELYGWVQRKRNLGSLRNKQKNSVGIAG